LTVAAALRSVRLYHYPASRSARAKWALHETVGDAFETLPLDLYAGAQYAPDYMAKNPNHNVPLLEIEFADGRTMRMIESAAMVVFLADAAPERKLAPAPGPSAERADYLQMLQFAGSPMDMMLWQIRIHEHVLPTHERDARTVDRYRGKFEKEIEPQLAARLEAAPFICGAAFTAADIMIGHNVGWARGYGMCRGDVFKAYQARLSERPAFRAAFADVGAFKPEPPQRPGGRTLFNG
jgi:glutathione S-transferase